MNKALETKLYRSPKAKLIREKLIADLLKHCEKMPIAQLHMLVATTQMMVEENE